MSAENPATLVKAAQSPALARVSNQLALTDKLLTKPEERFLIPYRKGNKWNNSIWGFTGMKTYLVPQQDMLFIKNINIPLTDKDSQLTYRVYFRSATGRKLVIDNLNFTVHPHVYINVSEPDLETILKECNLLVEGTPVADINKLTEGAFEVHMDEGYYGFRIVTFEELIPQYEGQSVAGSPSARRIGIDKDGNPVYRNNRVYFVEGYVVKDSKGNTIYNSNQDLNIFISKWKNNLSEDVPGLQAFKKAFEINLINPDSKLRELTSDETGRIEMPANSYNIVGFRTMTDDEAAAHVEWNKHLDSYNYLSPLK